jgi:membrane-bound lytic murein transglycosylase MltF
MRDIHPHARIWIVTAVGLAVALVVTQPTVLTHQPEGRVIAHYENDYQRYAIDQLTKQDKLEQWSCLYELWKLESNWRPKAKNKQSSAMGIPQLLDSTWENIGLKPSWNGRKQIDAGLKYIDRRYGESGNNICRAYAHHLAKGWY